MFYDIFAELCRGKNIAPSALARQLGMSASAPGRWRSGSAPDLDTITKIADFFGVSIDFLVRGQERPETRIVTAERSVVLQGNTGNNSVNNAAPVATAADGLSEQEEEILRIFRSLDMRKKTSVMSYFYELEDSVREVSGKK